MKRIPLALLIVLLLGWPLRTSSQAKQHAINLSCVAGANDATFNWYRSTTSGTGYALLKGGLTACPFSDTTGTATVKYFYVVTGVDSAGFESAFSAEVSAVYPLAPSVPSQVAATAQ